MNKRLLTLFLIGELWVCSNINAAALADGEIGRRANLTSSFLNGFVGGMESELGGYKPTGEVSRKADEVSMGLKAAVDSTEASVAAAGVPLVGPAVKTIGGGLMDIGMLITKAIIRHNEGKKENKYGRLTKVLQVATSKPNDLLLNFESLPIRVTAVYKNIILGLGTELDAEKFGAAAGKRVIDYIIKATAPRQELQSYNVWEQTLKGIITVGVDPNLPVPLIDPVHIKYVALANRWFAHDLPSILRATMELNDLINPDGVPVGPAPAVPDRTFLVRDLANNVNLAGGRVAANLGAASANIYALKTYHLPAEAALIVRELAELFVPINKRISLAAASPEGREREYYRIIENPDSQALALLGHLMNDEFVRALDFHKYKGVSGRHITFPLNYGGIVVRDADLLRKSDIMLGGIFYRPADRGDDGRTTVERAPTPWRAAARVAAIAAMQVTIIAERVNPSALGHRVYRLNTRYPELEGEIGLLNAMRGDLSPYAPR